MRIIKFEKDNCAPCKMIEQFLKENNIEHEVVNVFNEPEKAQEHKVTFSVPVLLVLDDAGNQIFRTVGFKPLELDKFLEIVK